MKITLLTLVGIACACQGADVSCAIGNAWQRKPNHIAVVGVGSNGVRLRGFVLHEERRAVVAAYVLGWNHDEQTIPVLRKAATSANEPLAVAAMFSLCRLSDPTVISLARQRLETIKSVAERCKLAGLLASNGNFDGWVTIRDTLLFGQDIRSLEFGRAIFALPEFAAMPDGLAGAAFRELHTKAANASPIVRDELSRVFKGINEKAAK